MTTMGCDVKIVLSEYGVLRTLLRSAANPYLRFTNLVYMAGQEPIYSVGYPSDHCLEIFKPGNKRREALSYNLNNPPYLYFCRMDLRIGS